MVNQPVRLLVYYKFGDDELQGIRILAEYRNLHGKDDHVSWKLILMYKLFVCLLACLGILR